LIVQESSEEDPVISLSNLPATSQQRRLVLAIAVLLVAAFAVAAPFANVELPRFEAFIPSVGAIIFVNDLITSALLFAQYSIVSSRAILALASGYLFTALIVIPQFSRSVHADRPSRRRFAEQCVAVFLLAYRLSRSGARLRMAEGSPG
jgi:hypothetical protein